MRFLHTADWHLGRLFHGASLLADQVPLLDQVVRVAREGAVDALILAGDIFDRAVPAADAVALFDDFLCRMALDLRVPVIAIAGNHDSAERLSYGARLMKSGGIHMRGRLDVGDEPVLLQDEHGAIRFHLLPYADPPVVRNVLARDDLPDHASALGARLSPLRCEKAAGVRSVVIAHAFVLGGEESESERPLSVGGSGAVPCELFQGFDYVALGHLHRPQRAGADHIRYAGSLAKYSFSEISALDYSIDGGPWMPASCTDGIFDTPVEKFDLTSAVTARRNIRLRPIERIEQVIYTADLSAQLVAFDINADFVMQILHSYADAVAGAGYSDYLTYQVIEYPGDAAAISIDRQLFAGHVGTQCNLLQRGLRFENIYNFPDDRLHAELTWL